MNAVQKELLSILSERIYSADSDKQGILEEEFSDELYAEAKAQAVSGFLSGKASAQIMAQNIKVLFAHTMLSELLSEQMPFVIIKGWASAYYYPNPILRQLGDVDFLIPMEAREQASEMLLANGYILEKDINPHHWCYSKNKISHELHWRLNGAPEGEMGEKIDALMADVWDRAQLVDTGSGEVVIPSDYHNGLIMLLHMAKHMTSSGMGLRHLCDWAVFVNHVDDFERLLRHDLESIGMWHFASLLTEVATKYLRLPSQSWVIGDDDAILEALLDNILGAGNFGRRKEANYSGVLMGDINADTEVGKHGKLVNLIRKLNKITRNYLPITIKHPILLPLGWIYIIFQYFSRVLQGKRKMFDPFEITKEADARTELYKQFHLFEVE